MSDLSAVASRVVGGVLLTRTPGNILRWGAFRVVNATTNPVGSLQLEIEAVEPPFKQFEGRSVAKGVYGMGRMFRNRGNPPKYDGKIIRLEDPLLIAGYDPAPMIFLI